MPETLSWTPFHARLHQTIRQRGLLSRQQSVLLAVSGGQDSLCLARLLLDLQPYWRWQLGIVHCNHRWRADADANAAYVAQLAQQWQVPFHQKVAQDPIPSEAAARDWRYRVMGAIAQEGAYQAVLTGHTASDRAETLLYNLVRGSGADGLQALTWTRPLTTDTQLVRPLLEFTRTDTAQVCEERDLRMWEDETNQDLYYARNRIRLELMPYLEAAFHPQVERHLAQTAELLRAEVALLDDLAKTVYPKAVAQDDPNTLNRVVLQATPLALQRRVVRHFLRGFLPTTPTFDHIEKVVQLVDAPNRSQTDPFPGGAIAYTDHDWIRIKSTTSQTHLGT